jgi:flagellar hook-basal body complex protein FliE
MTLVPPVGALGPEWQIGGIAASDPTAGVGGAGSASGSFGDMLSQQIGNLSDLQETAATASQSLADGTATDVASVVTAVEKAQLAMQLAGQIRTKGSEAINDIFHTQI